MLNVNKEKNLLRISIYFIIISRLKKILHPIKENDELNFKLMIKYKK